MINYLLRHRERSVAIQNVVVPAFPGLPRAFGSRLTIKSAAT